MSRGPLRIAVFAAATLGVLGISSVALAGGARSVAAPP